MPVETYNEYHLELFDRFWAKYPRKISKGAARKVYMKLFKGMERGDADEFSKKIWLAVDAQIRKRKQLLDENKFAPDWKHPATWLNNECWTDDVDDFEKAKPKAVTRYCQCGKATLGPRFEVCGDCYLSNDWRVHMMREYCKEHQIHKMTIDEQKEFIKRKK